MCCACDTRAIILKKYNAEKQITVRNIIIFCFNEEKKSALENLETFQENAKNAWRLSKCKTSPTDGERNETMWEIESRSKRKTDGRKRIHEK